MANDERTKAALRRLAAAGVMLAFVTVIFLSPPTLFFAQVSGLGPNLGDSIASIPVTTRQDLSDARGLTTVYGGLSPWRQGGPFEGLPDQSKGELTAAASLRHPDLRVPVHAYLVYTTDPETLVSPGTTYHDAGFRFMTPDGGLAPDRGGDLINVDVGDAEFAQDYWLTPEEGNRFQGHITARRLLVEDELVPPGPDGNGGEYDRRVVLTMYLTERRIDRDEAATYIRVSVHMEAGHNWTAAGTYTEAAGRLLADLVPELFQHRPPAPFLGVQVFRSGWPGALAVSAAFLIPGYLLIDHARRLNEARVRNLERLRFEAATRSVQGDEGDNAADEDAGEQDVSRPPA